MKIAKKVLKKIDESQKVKGMLADNFKKSHQTIQRWIKNNDEMLTTIDSLNIIHQELGFTNEEAISE